MINVKTYRILLVAISICAITFLTTRYFSPNGDYANSSLVWRMYLQNGYQAFFDWRPTPDTWYFTVYPLHFLLFYILGNDGIVPLAIASALYTIVLTFTSAHIVRKCTGSDLYWAATITCLTIMPEIMYLAGYLGHPFAHNSTNAFGMAMLALAAYNLQKRNLLITIFVGITLILTNASDMWISPTYFIPIIIGELYLFIKNRRDFFHISILVVCFVISVTHVVAILMGFPIQKFSVVPLDKILENISIAIHLPGETLNLLIIPSDLSFIASFFIAASFASWAFVISYKRGGLSQYIGIVTYFSLIGIISSFVISNVSFPPGPPRFFVSLLPCFIILISIAACFGGRFSWLFKVIILLSIISNINSYKGSLDYKNKAVTEISNHINFLKSNKLYYGYGDFWKMSQTVNLLSGGDITIVPIYMVDNTTYHDKYARVQTFKSWYTDSFRKSTPERQFISITKGHECSDVPVCVENAQKQVGKADEILNFDEYTYLVYNRRIMF